MNETKTTLKDFFYNGTSKAVLKEGKYEVKLLNTEYIEHPQNPYIKVTLQEIATNREITTNKFDRGFQIMIAHLKKQLQKEDQDVKVQEFLNDLIQQGTVFNIWVTIYTDSNTKRSTTNINFLEPLEPVQAAVQEDEGDEALPF